MKNGIPQATRFKKHFVPADTSFSTISNWMKFEAISASKLTNSVEECRWWIRDNSYTKHLSSSIDLWKKYKNTSKSIESPKIEQEADHDQIKFVPLTCEDMNSNWRMMQNKYEDLTVSNLSKFCLDTVQLLLEFKVNNWPRDTFINEWKKTLNPGNVIDVFVKSGKWCEPKWYEAVVKNVSEKGLEVQLYWDDKKNKTVSIDNPWNYDLLHAKTFDRRFIDSNFVMKMFSYREEIWKCEKNVTLVVNEGKIDITRGSTTTNVMLMTPVFRFDRKPKMVNFL